MATVRELAVRTPDAGFLDRETVSFLTELEVQEILEDVRTKLLPVLSTEVDHWNDNYDPTESPSDYFRSLKSALNAFTDSFDGDIERIDAASAFRLMPSDRSGVAGSSLGG